MKKSTLGVGTDYEEKVKGCYRNMGYVMQTRRKEVPGMNETDMANIIGRSPSYISQMERGIKAVPVHIVIEYAEALKTDPNLFFDAGVAGYNDGKKPSASANIIRKLAKLPSEDKKIVYQMINLLAAKNGM